MEEGDSSEIRSVGRAIHSRMEHFLTFSGTYLRLSRFFAILLLVLCVVFSSSGCDETENYKGVTFKPPVSDGDNAETSVFALVVKKLPAGHYEGKGSGENLYPIIGRDWIPVNGLTLTFDGKRKFLSATRGMYSLISVGEGNHTLSIATSDESTRKILFQAPLVVKKGKMTIVLIDVSEGNLNGHAVSTDLKQAGNYSICYKAVDLDFILKTKFKELTKEYLSISGLVSNYQKFFVGTLNSEMVDSVFHKDCRDEEGAIADRLMALKYRQATGEGSSWAGSSWIGALKDEYNCVILVTGNGKDGKVISFERFSARRSKPGETLKSGSHWKIASIGIDL
jgi:hypothetical protein